MNKKLNKNYDRVMSRVFDRSCSNLKSSSYVTRHEAPSSVRIGAKTSVSSVSLGAYSELPVVLNDYVPETSRESVRKSRVVKPRRTLRSMDTSKSPPRTVVRSVSRAEKPRVSKAKEPGPAVDSGVREGWADAHVRECHSSRSHTRLKELKDEIKTFRETEKLMKLRSHLYKKCGVVLDDVGGVAEDKAVQAQLEENNKDEMRRQEWLEIVGRQDLIEKLLEEPKARRNQKICEAHFEKHCIKFSKKGTIKYLAENAYPTLNLTTADRDASTYLPTAGGSASTYLTTAGGSTSTYLTTANECASTSLVDHEILSLAVDTERNKATQVDYSDLGSKTYESRFSQTDLHTIDNQNHEIMSAVDSERNNTILTDQASQVDNFDLVSKTYESRFSQTELHLSVDTTRKRMLSLELTEAKRTKTLDLDSVTKEDFLILCERFLKKKT